jgi:hypothetical protein
MVSGSMAGGAWWWNKEIKIREVKSNERSKQKIVTIKL